MQIGRIVGTIVSTQKDPNLSGMKLYIVENTDLMGIPKGRYVIAVDAVGAGEGELILYTSGSSARLTSLTHDTTVDAVIMSIVDSVTVKGETVYSKSADVGHGS